MSQLCEDVACPGSDRCSDPDCGPFKARTAALEELQKQREELEALRSQRNELDEIAQELRDKASGYAIESTEISHRIAEMPCDIKRTRAELLIHIGWYHKRQPPLGAPRVVLAALHERIVKERADGSH